jgi:hypothetical protein
MKYDKTPIRISIPRPLPASPARLDNGVLWREDPPEARPPRNQTNIVNYGTVIIKNKYQ